MKKLKVCWISAGISSFIAAYLVRDSIDKYIYIDIEDQHPDSYRFINDCEKILDCKIEFLQSRYKNVENAIFSAGIIKNPYSGFAPCTNWLKKRVRKEWEEKHKDFDITYVWGFDRTERNRQERIKESMPEFSHEFPLIEAFLSKQDCHAMASRLNLKRPIMYDLGYHNNNCIGCVKGGMWYWNKIRRDFPEVFLSRAKMERKIGHSIIRGVFLDELDENAGRPEDEIDVECGIMCYLQMNKYKDK